MKKKLLIVTTDETCLTWKSLPKKITAIREALNKTKNGDWFVEIVYKDLTPVLNSEKRIDRTWFNNFSFPYFREGYHHVALHFANKRWNELGIQSSLRGLNYRDTNFVGEMYFRGDENTIRTKRLNQFIQTLLHEMSHELAYATGVTDTTHSYHDKYHDISGIFPLYNIENWQPKYQAGMKEISRLQAILDSLLSKKRYRKPLMFHFDTPSQAYGIKNANWYPLTGHHIGVDFPTPVGSAIFAPDDCIVTRVGYLEKSLGNWCEVKIDDWYMVCSHLQSLPPLGERKSGWVIGFTGNTGFSTGPHVHIEGWYNEMDRSKLSQSTWNKLTFDITKKI